MILRSIYICENVKIYRELYLYLLYKKNDEKLLFFDDLYDVKD